MLVSYNALFELVWLRRISGKAHEVIRKTVVSGWVFKTVITGKGCFQFPLSFLLAYHFSGSPRGAL